MTTELPNGRSKMNQRWNTHPSGRIPAHVDALDGSKVFECLLDVLLAHFERDRSDVDTRHQRQRLPVHLLPLLLKREPVVGFLKFLF